MNIVLSQRIDYSSDYQDVPFQVYHFPKKYRSQIRQGDNFIYYQGNRSKREQRYYFGCGVIGKIEPASDKEHYWADIVSGQPFSVNVSIYKPDSSFYESIDYRSVRNSELPPWRNSVRRISDRAFEEILRLGGMAQSNYQAEIKEIETGSDPLDVIRRLNAQYANQSPDSRDRLAERIIDRGAGVVNALKRILGARCQICDWEGFDKKNNEKYIEAHHLAELARREPGALCSENVILLCPNCHKEIHLGGNVVIVEDKTSIEVTLSKYKARITRNSVKYLKSISK